MHVVWVQSLVRELRSYMPCGAAKKPQKTKDSLIHQNNTEKNKVRGLPLLNFKTHHKATVIEIVSYWHKDRHIDQWNRIESTEINSYMYCQLIFEKGANTIQ